MLRTSVPLIGASGAKVQRMVLSPEQRRPLLLWEHLLMTARDIVIRQTRPRRSTRIVGLKRMPLLGKAAMLLSFDVVPEAIAEHDDWHTHEHLPERLSIPGFVRGTRWVALRGQPRYFVMYEVEELATLTSAEYLARLNNPSPWTSKMMPHYRGMTRGFCTVRGSWGVGLGHAALLVRFKPAPGTQDSMRKWLLQDLLPRLPSRAGLGSVHLFEGALAPPMTNEQRIRGADAGVDWAILATGYREESVADLAQTDLGNAQFQENGGTGIGSAVYRIDYTLTAMEARE